MSILSKRSGFLGAILFVTTLLFANSVFAQTTATANLLIQKIANAPTVVAGTTLVYTVTATNNGPDEAVDMVISDTTPTGTTMLSLDFVSAPSGCSSPVHGLTGSVQCDFYTVPSGESRFIQFTVTVDPDQAHGSQISNTATVVSDTYDPDDTDNTTDPLLTDVVRESLLSVTKTPDPVEQTEVVAGTEMTYTIRVSNAGPSDASNVIASDTLPAFVLPVSTTGCDNDDPAPGGVPTCLLGTIAAGEYKEYTAVLAVNPATPAGSVLTNRVTVSSIDAPARPNPMAEHTVTAVRESAISITKTADPSPLVAQGGTQTYTIEVSNGGPSDASNLFVTETLPAGLTVTAMNPPGICNGTSGTVTCALPGPVAANDSYSFTLELDIPDDFPLGTITNTSRVECTDPACSTNTTPDDSAVLAEAQTRVVVAVPAEGTALIAVQKFFRDGNDETPVTLTLECTTGSYAPATVVVNPDEFAPGSAFEHIFVVTDIPTGAANACTVVEEPVAGYDATYICGQDGSTSTVDDTLCNGFADFTPGTTACGWLDVAAGDSNLCGIFNDPAPVEFAVTKVWDVSNTGGDYVSRDAEITIGCHAEMSPYTFEEEGLWFYTVDLTEGSYVGGEATVTVKVIPDYAGSYCFAEEGNVTSAVEVTSDCGSFKEPTIEVSVGQGAECTITNTVFFEGIPTLNQYGMALMALLMLGIGMVGFRRFV